MVSVMVEIYYKAYSDTSPTNYYFEASPGGIRQDPSNVAGRYIITDLIRIGSDSKNESTLKNYRYAKVRFRMPNHECELLQGKNQYATGRHTRLLSERGEEK